MCLAIPAKITERFDELMARVDIMGLSRDVSLRLTPEAQVGDYVLIHAGFSINCITEQEAQETLDLINQFPELASDETEALFDKHIKG